jgi:hypothetical protein
MFFVTKNMDLDRIHPKTWTPKQRGLKWVGETQIKRPDCCDLGRPAEVLMNVSDLDNRC